MIVALSSSGRSGPKWSSRAHRDSISQAGHVAGHELDVAADVADAVRDTGHLGVGPRDGLLLAGRLELGRQPFLGILGVDEADLADLSLGDHVADVGHDRVARVGIGHAEHQTLVFREPGELGGVLRARGEGLVADDGEAVFEGELRDGIVGVVRRHDDDEIGAVLALRLGPDHLIERPVEALLGEAEGVPSGQGIVIALGKAAGDDLGFPVHGDGLAVDVADEGALAAADHAVTKFRGLPSRCLSFDHDSPSRGFIYHCCGTRASPEKGQERLSPGERTESRDRIYAL